MITLGQLQVLVGTRCEAVQKILNGFELTYSDGSRLRVSAAWMEFEPGKQTGVGKKVKQEGEGTE